MDELLKSLDTVVSKSYNYNNKTFKYDNEIEDLLSLIEPDLSSNIPYIKSRWLGLRLIDGDKSIYESIDNYMGSDAKNFCKQR
ncbi:feoB family ferrous iron (Fe2+) uptake domain protein [[Clostridium] sordellii ATCC 9714]|nr:feoB family ferrous iron (Fe2+) uptake domain protein [[Clostridium] sordellii ATCC 9714] [Paeniclostridium sordellii ATCC 9714]